MSGARVELHPESQSEIRSTALWYEERRHGLGDEFIGDVSKGLWRIEQSPVSFPVWPGTGGHRLQFARLYELLTGPPTSPSIRRRNCTDPN
jgi:hypothetical protein